VPVTGNTPIEVKYNVTGLNIQTLEEEANRRAAQFFGEEDYRMQIDCHIDPATTYGSLIGHCRVWRPREYES
jgi:hypothetical protein